MRNQPDLQKCRAILGVLPGASEEEVKRAYHDLAKVWHPDRFPNDEGLQAHAQEKLKEINEAYQALKNLSPGPAPQAAHYSPPVIKPAHKAPDERFVNSLAWIAVVLIALAVLVFTFHVQGKPMPTASSERSLSSIL